MINQQGKQMSSDYFDYVDEEVAELNEESTFAEPLDERLTYFPVEAL